MDRVQRQFERRMEGLVSPPESLDRPTEQVQQFVQERFEAAPAAHRFLHGRSWLGHPLHPLLTDLVSGAWTVAWIFDVLQVFRLRRLRPGASAAVAIGLIGTPMTALSGASDWQHTTGRARRIGLVHAALNAAVTLAYLISLMQRMRGRVGMGMAWGHLGFMLLTVSAYLGGEMVYDAGVNVLREREGEAAYRQAG